MAFLFGLFHGLGFAGGLLEAMASLRTAGAMVAIAAFSLGVEIGHQLVELPAFGGLRLLRRTHADAPRYAAIRLGRDLARRDSLSRRRTAVSAHLSPLLG